MIVVVPKPFGASIPSAVQVPPKVVALGTDFVSAVTDSLLFLISAPPPESRREVADRPGAWDSSEAAVSGGSRETPARVGMR